MRSIAECKCEIFQRHEFILPANDNFPKLLVDFHHKINLHTGTYLLEASLRQKYWILVGRNIIRQGMHNF